MTLHIPEKMLLHVWSYDFYDTTLSTEKRRRHMIKKATCHSQVHVHSVYHTGYLGTINTTGNNHQENMYTPLNPTFT